MMKRLLKILLAAALTVGLAMPATATECLTVHLEHDQYGPQVVATDGWPELSFPGRLGDNIWFQWGDNEPIKVNVADPTIERVIGCTDGSVDVVYEQPATDSEDASVPVKLDNGQPLTFDLLNFYPF